METLGLFPVEINTKSASSVFPLSSLTRLSPFCKPNEPSQADESSDGPAGMETRSLVIRSILTSLSLVSSDFDSFGAVGGEEYENGPALRSGCWAVGLSGAERE